MLNAPNAESERRTLSTYLLQILYCGIVSESLQAQTADTHTPHSPTKETDSDAAKLLNWDNEACRTMVSWSRHGQAVWLPAK